MVVSESFSLYAVTDGVSVLTAVAFCRAASQPAVPVGGSYDSPKPTTTGWDSSIPAGTGVVWMSYRVFSSDGGQSDSWSTPSRLTSTCNMIVMWSSVADSPGNPTSHPSNWSESSSASSIWVAIQLITDDVAGAWNVVKLKGEMGKTGVMPRYRGVWNELVTDYIYDDLYRDLVVYNDMPYIVSVGYKDVTITPDMVPGVSEAWSPADGRWSFVAMETALIDGANIAGLIFYKAGVDDHGNPIGVLKSQAQNPDISWANDGAWIEDGSYRKSPVIEDEGFTKEIITFTAKSVCDVYITLAASSENKWDWGYLGNLDTTYTGSGDLLTEADYHTKISGTDVVTLKVTIPVGTHTMEIMYLKDAGTSKNEDCIRYSIESPALIISAVDGSVSCIGANITGTINAGAIRFRTIKGNGGSVDMDGYTFAQGPGIYTLPTPSGFMQVHAFCSWFVRMARNFRFVAKSAKIVVQNSEYVSGYEYVDSIDLQDLKLYTFTCIPDDTYGYAWIIEEKTIV